MALWKGMYGYFQYIVENIKNYTPLIPLDSKSADMNWTKFYSA